MKRFSLVAAVLTVSVTGLFAQPSGEPPSKEEQEAQQKQAAEYLAKLDGVPGFGGIAFGAEFSAKGFEIEQDRGSLKLYKKTGGKNALGPVLLETIIYYVFEGKFYGVAFHTNDGQDTLNLMSLLESAFGPGQSSAEEGPSTIWIGKKVGVLSEINTATGDGNAFLFDVALHDAFLKYESEAVQKAAAKLLKGE